MSAESDQRIIYAIAEVVPCHPIHARRILASLRSEGWFFVKSNPKMWPYCPLCGYRNRGVGEFDPDATYCSPGKCLAWKFTATFDHDTREWVPVRVGAEGQA